MSQFETDLKNLRENLNAEQQTFEQEEWAKINATVLADYVKEQDKVCNDGIAALQRQRDYAIAAKQEQLKAELKERTDSKFCVAREKLDAMIELFSKS